MFCQNCGNNLDDNSAFCSNCGSKIEENILQDLVVIEKPAYEVWGAQLPAVTLILNKNQSVYTQSGGMTWMSNSIEMSTNARGGVLKSLGRWISGESIFMVSYTAKENNQQITFASSMPGEIRVFEISSNYEIIAQQGAFLCATQGVEIEIEVTDIKTGFFGGEGFVLQRYKGDGLVFTELDGSIKEINLGEGETINVNTGNVAAFESSVKFSAKMVEGLKNAIFGGEGLFLTTLTGPGKIWLQTISVADFCDKIDPFLSLESE